MARLVTVLTHSAASDVEMLARVVPDEAAALAFVREEFSKWVALGNKPDVWDGHPLEDLFCVDFVGNEGEDIFIAGAIEWPSPA